MLLTPLLLVNSTVEHHKHSSSSGTTASTEALTLRNSTPALAPCSSFLFSRRRLQSDPVFQLDWRDQTQSKNSWTQVRCSVLVVIWDHSAHHLSFYSSSLLLLTAPSFPSPPPSLTVHSISSTEGGIRGIVCTMWLDAVVGSPTAVALIPSSCHFLILILNSVIVLLWASDSLTIETLEKNKKITS